MNVKFLSTCILTASLLFSATTLAQNTPDYANIIEQAHQKYKSNHDGNVADYIPALAAYSPNNFAITLATVDGKIYHAGDINKAFPMESLSKLFTLALAMEQRGPQEVLLLDVPDLDTANRCAVVTRKGGARDLIAWQTGTARLLPRLLSGRKTGPVFLTDRKARPSVARDDVDPTTLRARLSYRRAAELFETHTDRYDDGPYTLHQLRHSRLTHAAEEGASARP